MDTVLEAVGHRAELAAALAAALALVPHQVPLSRCTREEKSL